MKKRPEYTWRHGLAWLAVAAATYWVISGHAGLKVSPSNMALGYVLAIGAAIAGLFLIAVRKYP